MNLSRITHVYFLGIGGIGMSALARFFHAMGKVVAGYDKTPSALTKELEQEGIDINYSEHKLLIPQSLPKETAHVLVVWTPAVPESGLHVQYFRSSGYTMMKRAQVLGLITGDSTTVAIAGTHGKTTTTTLTTHLLKTAGVDCSAFLGGISGNYNTNLLLGKNLGTNTDPEKNIVVAEADEYDRSVLWLHPAVAVITSVDADHLDVYNSKEEMYDSYRKFASQVGRRVITKQSVLDTLGLKKDEKFSTYSIQSNDADAFAENIRVENGYYSFDLVVGGSRIEHLQFGLPGRHNVENAVAAVAAAKQIGLDDESVRKALASFRGVGRRFEFRVRSERVAYIDDYGHHPAELKACISSVRELFPGKKVTGIFQPHLFTRTRDFADDFARSLELLDDVILMEIYPARELPIPGITSSMLLGKINAGRKSLYQKDELVEKTMQHDFDVLLTMGAGDIDRFVGPLEQAVKSKFGIGA
jgi:UDP-N-acetylmuramate--alanine ligase